MIELKIIIALLITHWVGDFALQSQNMSQNKSHSNKWLTLHVFIYTTVLLASSVFYWNHQFLNVLLFVGINGIVHWGVDWFTSRWTSHLWRNQRVHDFFAVIGLDQLTHYLTLFITYKYIF